MKVKQITVYTTTEASELVADILFDIGCEGVSIYDSADFATLLSSDVIWDYVDENALKSDPVVRVVGCVDENASLAPLHELLDSLKRNCPFETGSLEISCNIVEADAWADEWKKYYSPQHYGKLTVVPEWIDYKAAPGETVVKMDPGMAFGTGEHESTRICLTLLEKTIKGGESVIDVGCGSGILAAVKELPRTGLIKKTGVFVKKDALDPEDYRYDLIRLNGTKRELILDDERDLFITQGDVRQVQLAKGAILSGFTALLKKAGIEMKELQKVLIAGQFGAHLPAEFLTGVGILPEEVEDRLVYVGNSSKTGAYMTLMSETMKQEMEALAEKIEYMELAETENYERIFTESMIFPGN